jgi:hypothetical protein
MISIVTSCIERELYLSRLLDSMELLGGCKDVHFEWHIFFQKSPASEKMREKIKALSIGDRITLHSIPEQKIVKIGTILEFFKRSAKSPFYLKLDDDALICSPSFLPRLLEIGELVPDAVIFPFEIAGYTNIHAPLEKRQVVYSEKSNLYYSVSHAILPSALSVFAPMKFIQSFKFPPEQNDAQVIWINAIMQKTPVFQLQNNIIVEHQEGAEGQHYRKQQENGQQW